MKENEKKEWIKAGVLRTKWEEGIEGIGKRELKGGKGTEGSCEGKWYKGLKDFSRKMGRGNG